MSTESEKDSAAKHPKSPATSDKLPRRPQDTDENGDPKSGVGEDNRNADKKGS